MFDGQVRYARDAFEGLALMDAVMAVKRGRAGRGSARAPQTPGDGHHAAIGRGGRRPRTQRRRGRCADSHVTVLRGPDRQGIPLADYAAYLDERALFRGQWGLKAGGDGRSYEDLVEAEGRPRLQAWLDRVQTDSMLEAAVIYGYWPAWSEGQQVVIGDPEVPERRSAVSPSPPAAGRHLCLADYLRPRDAGDRRRWRSIVTMGNRISEAANELFAADAYRDYMELHGLSVQLTEALAEYWHARAT